MTTGGPLPTLAAVARDGDDQRSSEPRRPERKRPEQQREGAGRGALDAHSYDANVSAYGAWVETPGSSRVRRFRYDESNESVQVMWQDNGPATLYSGVSPESHRAFVRAASKGRSLGLLGGNYRQARPHELDAPSS